MKSSALQLSVFLFILFLELYVYCRLQLRSAVHFGQYHVFSSSVFLWISSGYYLLHNLHCPSLIVFPQQGSQYYITRSCCAVNSVVCCCLSVCSRTTRFFLVNYSSGDCWLRGRTHEGFVIFEYWFYFPRCGHVRLNPPPNTVTREYGRPFLVYLSSWPTGLSSQ